MTDRATAFKAALIHLFGISYSVPAGFATGISERTIRRFTSGKMDVPAGVLQDVLTLVKAKQLELNNTAKALEKILAVETEKQ